MKPLPQVRSSGGRHQRSGSVLLRPGTLSQTRKPPQAPPETLITFEPQRECVFCRREVCRCGRTRWIIYGLTPHGLTGWGVVPACDEEGCEEKPDGIWPG